MSNTPDPGPGFCRYGCYWDCDHRPPSWVPNKHKPIQQLTYAEYRRAINDDLIARVEALTREVESLL